jgi:hypothetical protein
MMFDVGTEGLILAGNWIRPKITSVVSYIVQPKLLLGSHASFKMGKTHVKRLLFKGPYVSN